MNSAKLPNLKGTSIAEVVLILGFPCDTGLVRALTLHNNDCDGVRSKGIGEGRKDAVVARVELSRVAWMVISCCSIEGRIGTIAWQILLHQRHRRVTA